MKITIIKKGDMRRGCQTNKKILIRVDTNIVIKYIVNTKMKQGKENQSMILFSRFPYVNV